MFSQEELKKLLKTDKLVIGTKKCLSELKAGKLAKVLLAVNCIPSLVKDFEYYAKIEGTEIETLDYPNTELGALCKKPFSISVIGVRK
ncbi:MAG: ribosomal L7Ae/L30e/S12e/Gadd45 family protein [Candidatus Woesearchaeota archaeon]